MRFNMTVSCEMAALNLFFALFFRNCSRIFGFVGVFSPKVGFFKKLLYGQLSREPAYRLLRMF